MVTQVMYIFFAKRKGGIKVSTQYIPNLKEKDYKKIQLDPSRSSLPSSPMPSCIPLEESKLEVPFSPTRSSKLGIATRSNAMGEHHGAYFCLYASIVARGRKVERLTVL